MLHELLRCLGLRARGNEPAVDTLAPPPTHTQDEEPTPSDAPHAFVPLSDHEVLAALDPHSLWQAARAFARHLMHELRQQLRDAELLELPPGARWQQRAHAVVLRGVLHPASKQQRGSEPATTAPAVLPWLWAHAAPGPLAPGDDSLLPTTPQAAAAFSAQAAGHTAGPSGALLVLCPELESDSPTHSEGGGSSSEGGPGVRASPFASDWGQQQQPEEAAAESAAGGGPAHPQAGLRRVKSRRCFWGRGI